MTWSSRVFNRFTYYLQTITKSSLSDKTLSVKYASGTDLLSYIALHCIAYHAYNYDSWNVNDNTAMGCKHLFIHLFIFIYL